MKSINSVLGYGLGRIIGSTYYSLTHPISFGKDNLVGIVSDFVQGTKAGFKSFDMGKKVVVKLHPVHEETVAHGTV